MPGTWKNIAATFAIPATIIAVYLALSVPHPEVPGLYYDECIFVNAATGGTGGPFVQKTILGIPVMIMDYIGALKSYLHYPVFRLFGISPATIRLPMVLLSSVTLVLFFLLGCRLFGRAGGAALAALVATDPAFIYNVRMDFGPVALMLLFKVCALCSFFAFLETRRTTHAVLLGFSLILGFYDKLNFLWFIIALSAASIAVYGGRLRGIVLEKRKTLVPVLVFFAGTMMAAVLLVVVPILSYPSGMPETGLREKLFLIVGTLSSTFSGGWPYSHVFTGFGVPNTRANLVFIPVAAALAVAVRSLTGRVRNGRRIADEERPLLFFAILFLAVLLQIVATRQGGGPHHLMMLYPLHYLMLFSAVGTLRRILPAERVRPAAAVALLAAIALIGANLRADAFYLKGFREGRNFRPAWDPGIYRLAGMLEAAGADAVICADWGLQTQLFALGSPERRAMYVEASGSLRRADPADPVAAEFLYQRYFAGRNACAVAMAEGTGLRGDGGRNLLKLAGTRLPPPIFRQKIVSAAGDDLYEVICWPK